MSVFISYSRADSECVLAITGELDRIGVEYWLDRRDIPVSVPWMDEVRDGIRSRQLFAICESFDWYSSDACRLERIAAEELHKPVVTLDVQQPVHTSVRRIIDALGSLSEPDRLHAEVLQRSEAWDRAGRRRPGLPGSRAARRFRILTAPDARPLPPAARAYLAAGQRAARQRAAATAAVAIVAVLAVFLGILMPQVRARGQETLRSTGAVFTAVSIAHARTEADAYDGLQAAADLVRSGNRGAFSLDVMTEALDIPVPVESVVLPDPPVTGFRTDSRTADPVPVDDGGTPRPVAPPLPASPFDAPDNGSTAVVDVNGPATVEVRHGDDPVRRLSFRGPVGPVAVSPDGRTVAAGVEDRVELVDVASGVPKTVLRGVRNLITAVAWSSDGKSVWAIDGNHRVSRWLWRAGTRLDDEPSRWFVGLSAPTADGRMLAVAQDGDVLRLGAGARPEVVAHTGLQRVLSASFDQPGGRALLGTSDGDLAVVDLANGRTVPAAPADPGCVPIASAFLTRGDAAVVACRRGPVRRLSLDGGPAREMPIDGGGAGALTVGPDDSVYVAGDSGPVYRIAADFTVPEQLDDSGRLISWRSVAVSPDGTKLLLSGTGTGVIGYLRVGRLDQGTWNWYTPAPAYGVTAQQSRAAAISPDGSLGAFGMADGTVHYFPLASGDPGLTESGTSGQVTALSFTREGRVAAATRDGVVDELPGCPACANPDSLLTAADRRLVDARRMGLAP